MFKVCERHFITTIRDFLIRYIEITPEEMQLIVENIHFESCKKGVFLLREGEINNKIGYILKGSVRNYFYGRSGQEKTISFLFENNPLVDMSFFSEPSPSPNFTITMEDTELIWFSREFFLAFLKKHPRYETVLRAVISDFVMKKSDKSLLLRISSAKERYDTLLKMHPDIIQRVPLKHIASYLEMAVETLSRVRAVKE